LRRAFELAIKVFANQLTTISPAPTSEPWLTLHYDEWICIVKGRVVFEVEGGSSTTAQAGETVFISKGTRFRPSFPVGDTQCDPFA
jgi:ethanolamine utilization protein EutQ (cupin superfamily)